MAKEAKLKPVESVHIMRADDVYRDTEHGPCDFIQIDVEGHELYFLQGAREMLNSNLPTISGEFNSTFVRRFGYPISDAWELLSPLGYESFHLVDKFGHESLRRDPETGKSNFLFVHPSRGQVLDSLVRN